MAVRYVAISASVEFPAMLVSLDLCAAYLSRMSRHNSLKRLYGGEPSVGSVNVEDIELIYHPQNILEKIDKSFTW
jgi:hypothetical protein